METITYCPKCGARSDGGKYCRSCGTNLVVISDALESAGRAGSPATRLPGGTTLALFNAVSISNEDRDLSGHNAAAIFGTLTIDLNGDELPLGESKIRVYSIFSTVDVLLPNDVGVRVTGVSVFGNSKVRGEKSGGGMFATNEYISPGYHQTARRVHIDATSIFGEVKVRR
jgi:hypothetical protein